MNRVAGPVQELLWALLNMTELIVWLDNANTATASSSLEIGVMGSAPTAMDVE